jgi:hypothetical protein
MASFLVDLEFPWTEPIGKYSSHWSQGIGVKALAGVAIEKPPEGSTPETISYQGNRHLGRAGKLV